MIELSHDQVPTLFESQKRYNDTVCLSSSFMNKKYDD